MKLSDRALLVQLNISQWTARKYDRRVTKEVADAHGAAMGVGRYNKSLLPMNDYLDHVAKKASSIRNTYYKNTLPWGLDGTQMLPTANYLEFMTFFRKEKSEWEYLVSEFVTAYPRLKEEAKMLLPNGLYTEEDYPLESEVTNRFRMDMVVLPVPATDFRVQIADEELTRIQADVANRLADAQRAAMTEVWTRLYEPVSRMAERLTDPNAILRTSFVEGVSELCALLPRLNVTDDPNLEAMRCAVEAKLTGHHPESLRNDPDLRRDTAAEAKAIMDKMRVFMAGL